MGKMEESEAVSLDLRHVKLNYENFMRKKPLYNDILDVESGTIDGAASIEFCSHFLSIFQGKWDFNEFRSILNHT